MKLEFGNWTPVLHRCQELFQGPCFQLGHCRRRADLASMSSVVSRSLIPVGTLPTMSRSCIHVKRCFKVLDSSWNPANDEQILHLREELFQVLDPSWGTANNAQILHRCQELFPGLDSSWGTANDAQLSHRCREVFQGPGFQWNTAGDEQILHRCQELFQGP